MEQQQQPPNPDPTLAALQPPPTTTAAANHQTLCHHTTPSPIHNPTTNLQLLDDDDDETLEIKPYLQMMRTLGLQDDERFGLGFHSDVEKWGFDGVVVSDCVGSLEEKGGSDLGVLGGIVGVEEVVSPGLLGDCSGVADGDVGLETSSSSATMGLVVGEVGGEGACDMGVLGRDVAVVIGMGSGLMSDSGDVLFDGGFEKKEEESGGEVVVGLCGIEKDEGMSGDVGMGEVLSFSGDCGRVLDKGLEKKEKKGHDSEARLCGMVKNEGFGGRKSGGAPLCSLKIEMIDGTVLVDVSEMKGIGDFGVERGGIDGRRRKRKEAGKRGRNARENRNGDGNGVMKVEGSKIVYTREEMERLRNVNVRGQRKMWNEIYNGLAPNVRKEYDELGSLRFQKQQHGNQGFENCQAVGRRTNFHGILETKSSVDNVYGDNVEDDGNYAMDEFGEDEDSDDDYECIKRPAFLVEGEPNFDSGPPEDGLEYLRRVRWEASQIPDVKVAKLKDKLKKEQTVYMPQIPDIEKFPVHLAPSKQWEDEFLSDFSELRLALSQLETPCDPQIGELCLVLNHEKRPAWAVIREVDVGYSEEPVLSTVLGMDLATRVKMLTKRIGLLEQMSSLSRNDCLWLFALCATVDIPLHADTAAALRGMLRKCAKLLAPKTELDDEVVMLNILATISGKFFGQSEN